MLNGEKKASTTEQEHLNCVVNVGYIQMPFLYVFIPTLSSSSAFHTMKGIFFREEINVSHYQGEVSVGHQPITISLVFAGIKQGV